MQALQGKQQSCPNNVLVFMKKSYIPSGDELCWAAAVEQFRRSVVRLNGGEEVSLLVQSRGSSGRMHVVCL